MGKQTRKLDHIGDYVIRRIIGQGSWGKVYLCQRSGTQTQVAVKVLSRHLAEDPQVIKRFESNAGAAAKLHHTNIVRVREIGAFEGRHYFAMDYVEGENLQQRLERQGKLSPWEALSIATQAAQALDFAHKKSVLHGNIKPENLLVATDGTLKLSDFSGGKADADAPSDANLDAGADVTLPDSIAMGETDTRKDIFDLGTLLYRMLTGEPFPSGAKGGIALKPKVFSSIPEAIRPVLSRMCDPDPAGRFQKPAELLSALNKIQVEKGDERAGSASAPAAPKAKETHPRPAPEKLELDQAEPEKAVATIETHRELATPPAGPGKPPPAEAPPPAKSTFRRFWLGSAAVAFVVCLAGLVVLGRFGPQQRPSDDRVSPKPSEPAEPSPDVAKPEEKGPSGHSADAPKQEQGFTEKLQAAEKNAQPLADAGHFGEALDLFLDLEVEYGSSKEYEALLFDREKRLVETAEAAFAMVEESARECGDPAKAIDILQKAAKTFGLVSVNRRAEVVIKELKALLDSKEPTEPAKPPETKPADDIGEPPDETGGASPTKPAEQEPDQKPQQAAGSQSELPRGQGSIANLASELLRYFRDRDYAMARKCCMAECARQKDQDVIRRLTASLDLITEAEQFWTDVEKGAQQTVGRPCSIALLAGTGSIKLEGVLKSVEKGKVVIEGQGRDIDTPLRSLSIEDAAALGAAVLKPLESATQRAIGIVYLLDPDLGKAREWLDMAGGNGQDVETALAMLNDPNSVPRMLEDAVNREKAVAFLKAVREGTGRGDAKDVKERLAKLAATWKGTELGKEIEAEIEKLSKEPEKEPAADVAAKVWESVQQNAQKGKWNRVLELIETLTRRFAESEAFKKNEAQIRKLAIEASMRLCEKRADDADSREAQKLPSSSRPDVAAVRPDGKGEFKALDEAIAKSGVSGIILASAGRFTEQVTIGGAKGTAEKPFAILGVPGGSTALSGLQDIEDCRDNKDDKTLWFPSLQLPPDPTLLQDGRALTPVNQVPTSPGTYFLDEKTKRCIVCPFKTAQDEKPTFQVQVPVRGNTIEVRACEHLLLRDICFENTAGSAMFRANAKDVVLQRVAAHKHGPFLFEGGPVTLKDCILPVTCRFPSAPKISATHCVFRGVELGRADAKQEALFKDCLFLGGLVSENDPHTRLILRNCIFFQCQDAVKLQSGENVEISDCIFAETLQCAIAVQKAGESLKMRNNCLWHNGSDYGGGAKEGVRCLSLDPLFESWDKGDFRLRADSPCRGKATDGGDIGVNWAVEQWGRWFHHLFSHPGTS
jgi:hypothetical protein